MEATISTKLKFQEAKKKYRLSTKPNPNGRELIAAAQGLIFIALDNCIYALPTQLLIADLDGPNQTVGLDRFSYFIQLNFSPTIISVAQTGQILLASGIDPNSGCPVLEAFDIKPNLHSPLGRLNLSEQDEIIDHAWHTENETLLALCTRRGNLMAVIVCRNQRTLSLVYNNAQFGALTCCWSPKGKNLAIGMANGHVRRLEPVFSSKFTFKEKDQSTMTFHQGDIPPGHQVVKLRWINKTYLLSVHANPNNFVDTTYSLFTVKPSNPYRSWKNICFENQNVLNYVVHIANLSSYIVCSPNRSAEVGIIGSEGSADDWNSILIDEEGARIELPLDSNNQETQPVGLASTSANIHGIERPILFFYTSDSLICAYVVMHSDNAVRSEPQMASQKVNTTASVSASTASFKPSSLIPPMPSNIAAPVIQPAAQYTSQFTNIFKPSSLGPALGSTLTSSLTSSLASSLTPQMPSAVNLSMAPSVAPSAAPKVAPLAPTTVAQSAAPPVAQPSAGNLSSSGQSKTRMELARTEIPAHNMDKWIADIKKSVQQNKKDLSRLEDVNRLRMDLEQIQEIHNIHNDVLAVVKADIDSLDIGMLEDLYLIEYLKSRGKKKSLDHITLNKIDSVKMKIKALAEKLEELNVHVDLSWEDFSRRKKDRRINSLDTIYRTLATNQKIITALKRKVATQPPSVRPDPSSSVHIEKRELNPVRIKAFKNFLASRTVVPVRRPVVRADQ